MTRAIAGMGVAGLLCCALLGQSAETAPKFDLADVHASAKAINPYMSGGVLRGGRYDIKNATMLDLIRTAYGMDDNNKVVGGPPWLDTDRFDIVAKAPPPATQDTANLMLQDLLADRFKLVVHKDSKPMAVFVLSLGKGKPKLKPADGKGEPGCQSQPRTAAAGVVQNAVVVCRGMTMEAFAAQLRGRAGNYITSAVLDQTGLMGAWDFDIQWTGLGQLARAGADGISIFDAVDKQLGLKLEPQKVAMPVIVVDSVNQKPTDNPPGVTTSLPPVKAPAEFEVASVRPSMPGAPQTGRFQNDRMDLKAWTLRALIQLAWDVNGDDAIADAPKFLDSARFDVAAKAAASDLDFDDLRVMLRALLVERFKLATHMEARPVNAYTLSAAKPKLKKADPSNRSGCNDGPGPDGKDPRDQNPINARLVTCLNTTMAQLAAQLQDIGAGYIQSPVVDATGIEGAYDLTLNFARIGVYRNSSASAANGAANAADPSGAISLFDAVNKQLGLKLELQKRPMPVLVIDHVEEKPTDN